MPDHPNTPSGLVTGYLVVTCISFLPQLWVICAFASYSAKMEDGDLDMSQDRQMLSFGMIILIIKEVLTLFISFMIVIGNLGFGPAWQIFQVQIFGYTLLILIYNFWRLTYTEYFEQMVEYEYAFEFDEEN